MKHISHLNTLNVKEFLCAYLEVAYQDCQTFRVQFEMEVVAIADAVAPNDPVQVAYVMDAVAFQVACVAYDLVDHASYLSYDRA